MIYWVFVIPRQLAPILDQLVVIQSKILQVQAMAMAMAQVKAKVRGKHSFHPSHKLQMNGHILTNMSRLCTFS